MARNIEIIYDNSSSMTEIVLLNNINILKFKYAQEVFKDTILPVLDIQYDDIVTLRKLRSGGCDGSSYPEILPNNNSEILRVLNSIDHNNATPLYQTIKDSFNSFRASNTTNSIIVIITDGEDTCNEDISEILSKDLIDKINATFNIVLVPLAIENRKIQEKFKKVSDYIGATSKPIGDSRNRNPSKNRDEFEQAVNKKRPRENEIIENDINKNNDELSYPLNHCYEHIAGEVDWLTLIDLNISFHNSLRLFYEDLLSWEPVMGKKITGTQLAELNFLYGIIFKSGLGIPLAKTMLSQLKKPYYYDNKCIYWSFSAAKWKYFKHAKPLESNSFEKPEVFESGIQQDKIYEIYEDENGNINFEKKRKGKNTVARTILIGANIIFKERKRKR